MRAIQRSVLTAVVVVIAGCGGGGGSAPAPPLVCADPAAIFSTYADASIAVGKAAGAVIAGCSGPLANVRWTQTAGPSVALLSDRTQAISFEPPSAGTYSFRVDFADASGAARSASVSVEASVPSAGVQVVARADQAVRKGGTVSLRVWPPAGAGEQTSWQQLDGPAATLDTSDPNRIIFNAPEVGADTALRFRVTRRTASGNTDSDDVLVLVENYAQAPAGNAAYVFSGAHVSRVHPYRGASPYANVLVRCVYDAGLQSGGSGKNLCPLSQLPLLDQETGGALPTVEQVMNRVLVSHDWIGEVFERFLASADLNGDIRRLLNGVTAIVIGAHVRPSFYNPATAAIYLDADHFWLTPAQRDVIDEAPDFRIDFARDLNYGTLWRYALNDASIFLPFPADRRLTRDLAYLQFEANWLLYHELGHGADYIPPAVRGTLNSAVSAWDNAAPRYAARHLPSDRLQASLPLTSQPMFGLGRVKFWGVAADATQRAYTPADVTGFFLTDAATDDYSYSISAPDATPREDAALLFEEFMMARNLGARRDFAITTRILPDSTSRTILVHWGERGRVGDAAVKPRAKQIVSAFAPWIDAAAVDALAAPISMRAGESWADNVVLGVGTQGAHALRTQMDQRSDAYLLQRALRRPGAGRVPSR
jgi:hypothetical protein